MKKLTGEFRETVVLDGKDPATRLYCTDFADYAKGAPPDDDKIFNSIVTRVKSTATKPILVVSADTSHVGFVNDNFRYYKPETARVSAKSWTNPYPKPVLVEHRLHDGFAPSEDPIGRVARAMYVPFQLTDRQKNDIITRKGVQRVYATIVGQDNIEKVMDGRYLTISTRGISNSIKCSVCGTELMDEECEHEAGQKYDGNKLAYMIYDTLTFREWSFVKLPADVMAKTNRYELIVPAETISSEDGNDGEDSKRKRKILPVDKQIGENIGAIGCDCPDAQPNVSIYFMPKNGVFYDMVGTNAVGGHVVQEVLDGVDLYECKGGVCSYKSNVGTDTGEGEEDKIQSEFSDHPNSSNKEDDGAMDNNIKTFEDLLKLDFVKKGLEKYESDQVSQLKQDVSTKDSEIKTLKSEIEAKDTVIQDKDNKIKKLGDNIKQFEEQRKELLADNIIELQKELKHPIVEAIMKKEKDTQDKELKSHRDELLKRDLESLEYTYKDLQAESELKSKDNNGDGAGNNQDADGSQGNNGITDPVNNGTPPVNNQAADSSGNPNNKDDKNNPVDKLFT